MQKPSIPKGTRDFSPEEMAKRNYIFDTIREVYHLYGFRQIETPAMENLSTLMGKYGEEGDKLLFKILNSGDFMAGVKEKLHYSLAEFFSSVERLYKWLPENGWSFEKCISDVEKKKEDVKNFINLHREEINKILNLSHHPTKYLTSKQLQRILPNILTKNGISKFRKYFNNYYLAKIEASYFSSTTNTTNVISEKGLRYDLTVPFARYVVQHRNEITFPFKRYQIQPVWRADRPQRGRYREFFQCDADVVGSDSLLNEVELIQIIDEVFHRFGFPVQIKMNNRKILTGIAEIIGQSDKIVDITVAIDKLDKIGLDKVNEELASKGISEKAIEQLQPIINLSGSNREKINTLKSVLSTSVVGMKGIEELEYILERVSSVGIKSELEIDLTLARGLNYYTGAIFEVKAVGVEMGSIVGGGRYDNLTGIFGMPGVSGVGISFGADRIFDVLNQLDLYPSNTCRRSDYLILNLSEVDVDKLLSLLNHLRRQEDLMVELYPDKTDIKKQLSYANKRKFKYAVIVGTEEIEGNYYTVKDLDSSVSGNQFRVDHKFA